MRSTVNERVLLLRTKLKLTQQEFSSKLGMSQTGIWKLESGESNPRKSTLINMAKEFGVNKDWLINGEGEMMLNSDKSVSEKSESVSEFSWKDETYSRMEAEIQHLRTLVSQLITRLPANFNTAFDLVALLNSKKSVESVSASLKKVA